MGSRVDLDVVIPVYNEGANIRRVLTSLARSVRTPFRVLICYDSDDDTTLAVLAADSVPGVDVMFVKNRGHGALGAVLSGFEESTAPAVVVIPADDDYNAPMLDRLVDEFRAGADIAVASRFMPGGCMEGCPPLKATLVRGSAFLLYHVARIPVRDATNGLRLFSRRVLDSIPIESTVGFAYSIELLVKCHRLRWKITELPAVWHQRATGESRFRVVPWLPQYVKWFLYAFATTYLFRGPGTVTLRARTAEGR